ncbi:MAG: hypothetical protein RL540_1397 [Actinomycetota bacterium]
MFDLHIHLVEIPTLFDYSRMGIHVPDRDPKSLKVWVLEPVRVNLSYG